MTTSTVVPAEYTLVIPQRATLRETIELPFAGTGKAVVAQVWNNAKRGTLLFELDVEVLEASPLLTVAISAPWTVTREVRKGGVWDLLVINADDTRDHWLSGPEELDERVTEETP